MTPKKSLGQNFLMHRQIAERIAEAAGLEKNDTVLEIGPGTGMLTRALLTRAKKVIAVEADDMLAEELKTTFASEISDGLLLLIHGDIRAFDAGTITEPYKLVANIPYYITGEIIRTFLSGTHKPSSMTLLVQKEVAERIVRSKKESLLSLSVKVYGIPSYCFTVPRGAFRPAPNVDSAVLHVAQIQVPFTSRTEEDRFFKVLKTGFMHKRKRLSKNLAEIVPSSVIELAFAQAGIPIDARSEDVPLSAWRSLTQAL